MNISVGIVGLPNVGKSTLFNALLKKQQALAANYPFATIEPNVGIVPVSDDRLNKLAEITKEENGMSDLPPIKNALVEFVDIAGIVKGASEGAGLGNKFLANIREVKVIAHVVRAFEDSDVIKEGAVDPKSDYETIRTELALSDLQSLQNQESRIKNQEEKKIVQDLIQKLDKGESVASLKFSDEEIKFVNQLNLLSIIPEIIVLNVAESDYNPEKIKEIARKYSVILGNKATPESGSWTSQDDEDIRNDIVVVSAKIESELAELGDEDAKEYLKELGVEKSGLERLIQKAYDKLGLISFLTAGAKEVKAWTIKKGSNAVEASGAIHTDFMKKFIKAEVVSLNDFVENNGWKGARGKGKARLEGRDYIVNDGDIVEFKIGG